MASVIGTPKIPKPYMRSWLPEAVKDPISLHDILLTGAQCLQRSTINEMMKYDQQIQVHKGQVLRLVNKAVGDETMAIRDSIIAGLVELQIDKVSDRILHTSLCHIV
jgi:hypothetical protein